MWLQAHYLKGVLERELVVSHEISRADGSGAAAAVLAVHQRLAPGPHGRLDGRAAGLEVPVQVLGRVVEHGHTDAADAPQAGEGLLPGDIDAQGDPLPLQQLLVARCPGRAQEQRGRDRPELEHRRPRGPSGPGGGAGLPAPAAASQALLYLSSPHGQGRRGSRQVLVPAASRELH